MSEPIAYVFIAPQLFCGYLTDWVHLIYDAIWKYTDSNTRACTDISVTIGFTTQKPLKFHQMGSHI